MRRKIVAGNWKMNKTVDEAKQLTLHLNTFVKTHKVESTVILAVPNIFLCQLQQLTPHHKLEISAQDISSEIEGAFTGEVSAKQMQSIDVGYTIVGHSERRQIHGEENHHVGMKAVNALTYGMQPIVCVGEQLEDRKKGKEKDIVKAQVEAALENISEEDMERVIIAYEPVWAIGTGETASPTQAQEMHQFIRHVVDEKYGPHVADMVPILYGGSVKPGNARDLFEQPDIDGGLVGGASLNYDDFTVIIHAMG